MAGIGQRNNFDHPSSWSNAAQLGVGPNNPNDPQKNAAAYSQNADKRPLLSNTSTNRTLASLAGAGTSYNYTARPSSSTRLKEMNSSGNQLRGTFNQEPSMDNLSMNYPQYGLNSSFPGSTYRGFSESAMLPGLGNLNHAVNSDLSSLMSGLGLSQKSFLPGNKSSINNMGLLNANSSSNLMKTGASSGLTFDPSDFPPIVNSTNTSQNQSFSGSSQSRNYVSAISKGGASNATLVSQSADTRQAPYPGAQSPEFSIERDFPALPGVQNSTKNVPEGAATTSSSISPENPQFQGVSSNQSLNVATGGTLLKASQGEQGAQRSQSTSQQTGAASRSPENAPAAATASSGNVLRLEEDNIIANIPPTMINNQMGMIGLMKLIQIDNNFEILAPGLNLQSLGLTSWVPGELHSIISSPLTDNCTLRPQDIEYPVPPEYRIRRRISRCLPEDPPLELFTDEVLLYIFYNFCREEIQLVAAKELYNRDWRFYKKIMRWITPLGTNNVPVPAQSSEVNYLVYEPLEAKKVVRPFPMKFSELDETPRTYNLSSKTINARIQPLPSFSLPLQLQNNGYCFPPAQRVPRQVVHPPNGVLSHPGEPPSGPEALNKAHQHHPQQQQQQHHHQPPSSST